jgi:hypothetical protein
VNGLPEIVRTAFERAGIKPPQMDRVDRIGYSAEEVLAIKKELTKRHEEEE